MPKNFIVAIDGPAGSGKSTSAKLVAQKLGTNVLGQVPIGQPLKGHLFTGSEPIGKAFDDIAVKVMKEMEI